MKPEKCHLIYETWKVFEVNRYSILNRLFLLGGYWLRYWWQQRNEWGEPGEPLPQALYYRLFLSSVTIPVQTCCFHGWSTWCYLLLVIVQPRKLHLMTQPFIQLSLSILLEYCVVVLNSRYVDNLDFGCVAYVSTNLHSLATPYLWLYVDIWQDKMVLHMKIRCAEYENWWKAAADFIAPCMCPFSFVHLRLLLHVWTFPVLF